MNDIISGIKQRRFGISVGMLLVLLAGTLAVLCHEAFGAHQVFWANDVPMAAVVESSARLPSSFFGSWADFYWLGGPNAAFPPNLTNISAAILTPTLQYKVYPPGTMLFLGFAAWFFFRQLRLSTLACVIGGLGAGLNMHFFSNACWGLGQWEVCCAMIFIALGILVSPSIKKLWIRGALAGLSVGMAVMEGNDVGAIMSLYVAIFVVFLFLSSESNPAKGLGKAFYVGAVLVLCAFLISLSTISTLIGTQLTGTASVGQSKADQLEAWDRNTQWSIPKIETLRMIIPGLFGYRLDVYTTSGSPEAYYWGSVAEDPHVVELESSDAVTRSNASVALHLPQQIINYMAADDNAPAADIKAKFNATPDELKGVQQQIVDKVKGLGFQLRHTGSGEYTGVLVCLLAIFGLASTARRKNSPFNKKERRMVWFWGAVALLSLMTAWGRYGFLYSLVYHMPLLASFRNPQKYMHPLNISMMILAAYGLEVLSRQYLSSAAKGVESFFQQLWQGWKRASVFEVCWAAGCAVFFLAAVIGYFKLASSKPALIEYLMHNRFSDTDAPQIANFAVAEVAWFLIYLLVSMIVIFCILAGSFSGRRAVWAGLILAAIMACDLGRSDRPWVRYYDYTQTMSPNPLTDLLKKDPWEHRVNSRSWPEGGYMTPNLTLQCHWWLENDYPFNDIESLEIDQMPRMPVLDGEYLNHFVPTSEDNLLPMTRLWQLCNTRYILAGAEWEDKLNKAGVPPNSFRPVMRMNLVPKPGVATPRDGGDMTVQTNNDGPVILYEFTAALPRVKLFADWQVLDNPTGLQMLSSPVFDPARTVVVSKDTPITQTPGSPGADPGTVKISHYQSKHLVMDVDAKTPAVLLLNDRTGANWHVLVDDKPAPFLTCNYIMQGTFVPAGHHTVEFKYQPPLNLLMVSLATFGLGLVLAGFVIASNWGKELEEPSAASESAPPPPPAAP
ncbi:MAG TPA: hypothetical protein VGO59_09980 [Verrucomicrobiae bacterium]|jgi:hypothetical protein